MFAALVARLGERDWVVYSQPPCAGAEVVLKYLARYVSRVALSESRLLRLAEGRVTFTVKDYRADGRPKELTLEVVEFLRRWTEHVLPRGFVAARHYGLLANRGREGKLALCRRLLWPLVYVVLSALAPAGAAEAERCPRCGEGPLVRDGEVAPAVGGPVAAVAGLDSS